MGRRGGCGAELMVDESYFAGEGAGRRGRGTLFVSGMLWNLMASVGVKTAYTTGDFLQRPGRWSPVLRCHSSSIPGCSTVS